MSTERGLDRLLFFTDAVVAIAATLLVVPLVENAVDYAGGEGTPTAAGYLDEAWPGLLAFAISFTVIGRLWMAHHSIVEHVADYDRTLVRLDLLWAFTIVVLPLPTVITSELPTDRVSVALYTGTMLASSLALLAIVLHVRRHAELRLRADVQPGVLGTVTTSLLFAVALVVGVAVASYLPLLVLLLSGPVELLLRRRWPQLATAS